jgi:hypothetical protein
MRATTTNEVQKQIAVTVFLDANGNMIDNQPAACNSDTEYEAIEKFLRRLGHEDAAPETKEA